MSFFESPLIAAAATIIAAILVSVFAYCQIRAQRRLQKQTLSIREAERWWRDPALHKDIAAVIKIGREEDIVQYVNPENAPSLQKEEWERKRETIIRSINYFEMIAIGVIKGILDAEIIEAGFRSMILQFHEETEPFIKKMQEKHEKAGSEFEKLVKRLKNENTRSA